MWKNVSVFQWASHRSAARSSPAAWTSCRGGRTPSWPQDQTEFRSGGCTGSTRWRRKSQRRRKMRMMEMWTLEQSWSAAGTSGWASSRGTSVAWWYGFNSNAFCLLFLLVLFIILLMPAIFDNKLGLVLFFSSMPNGAPVKPLSSSWTYCQIWHFPTKLIMQPSLTGKQLQFRFPHVYPANAEFDLNRTMALNMYE